MRAHRESLLNVGTSWVGSSSRRWTAGVLPGSGPPRSFATVGGLLSLLAASACLDPTFNSCDEYLDYLCTCDPEECDARREVFEGAGDSLQVTCRSQLACFDEADAEGGTCHLFDEGNEEECAPT